MQYLKEFIGNHKLEVQITKPTFVNAKGEEVSTIDYFLYEHTLIAKILSVKRLDTVICNVSDHYPIMLSVQFLFEHVVKSGDNCIPKPARVNWKKVDGDLYAALVRERLPCIPASANTVYDMEKAVRMINKVLTECAEESAPKRQRRARKAKLRTWTPEIRNAITNKKKAFYLWKSAGKPKDDGNELLKQKTTTTKELRRLCRKDNAHQYMQDKQEILDAKGHDSALFYRLINKHRSKSGVHLNELHVGDSIFKSEEEIMEGWREHFGGLATQSSNPLFDEEYRNLVEQELIEIIDICESNDQYDMVTQAELADTLSSLNKGKAADIYGLTTEHLLFASDTLLPVLTSLMNSIFRLSDLPDSLKLGLLTPVFKKKGSSLDAKNYRGNTILPILSKLLESILRTRIEPNVVRTQNSMQRGFTKHSSPMNCSLILEEYIRENRDLKKDSFIAFLDAKAAFDVVNHPSLMRKLFHIGVEGVTWNLIHSLHKKAQTVVRWCGATSEPFEIQQGVRQGGVLSTDLYKVYSNPLLDRVTSLLIGGMVGEISCAAPACADDVTFTSDEREELQVLVNEGDDYSGMERFLLQPVKSVVMPIPGKARKTTNTDNFTWTIKGEPMPIVQEATHMGIKRSAVSNESTVEENIKKARKTMYSLMGPGLHGYNGLDPETSVQLYQIYVLPT